MAKNKNVPFTFLIIDNKYVYTLCDISPIPFENQKFQKNILRYFLKLKMAIELKKLLQYKSLCFFFEISNFDSFKLCKKNDKNTKID